jgi:hypothetical protein
VVPQPYPGGFVAGGFGAQVVKAGPLEEAELPDCFVHVRRVEHADLGELVEVGEGESIVSITLGVAFADEELTWNVLIGTYVDLIGVAGARRTPSPASP